MKILSTIIFWSWFTMLNAEPFSLKEVNAIPDFILTKPQFLTASDDVELAYYPFAESSNNNVVILYAGAGLYGNKPYQWIAKTLHEKHDIGCYVFDIRGHGHSQGPRGDAPSIQQVLNDVSSAIALVKEQHPTAKVFLTGHSSGAALIINYNATSSCLPVDGYIFISPYLGPNSKALKEHKDSDQSFVKAIRVWVYILGAIFPTASCIHWNAVFFNYSEQLLKQDPLIVPDYTYVMSMATTPYEVSNLMAKIQTSTAIFIGSDDEQFIPEKVIDFATLIKAPVKTILVDGAKHLSILLDAPRLIAQHVSKNTF